MKSMTLMPMAAVSAADRPRTLASYVHVPETFGALPSMAARAHRDCTWSPLTNGTAIRQAKGLFKANGTRRLWEPST